FAGTALGEISEAAAHEAGTYVLEGQGGAVKKLQRKKPVAHLYEGKVEIHRFLHYAPEFRGGNGVAYIGNDHPERNFFPTQGSHLPKKRFLQHRNLFRKI